MIFSLLPAFLATLPGTPSVAIGLIEGVAEATASTAKVVSGRVTDRISRKKPLVLAGYGLSSSVRPLIAMATGWPAVLILRFLDRIGKGIRSAPRDTLIASVTPASQRGAAYGLHRAFDNTGAFIGPLAGAGLLMFFGLEVRTVFALSIIPGALAVLVLILAVRERADSTSLQASIPALPATPLPPRFWRILGVIFLFTLSASSDSFLLLKALELGMPAATIPLLWAFSNAIRAGFSRLGGGLSDRFGRMRILTAAWTIYAFCYAAFAFLNAGYLMLGVFAIYSLHAALSEGTERALVADLVPPAARGRAFGWFHGVSGVAALPASAVFGWVWKASGSKAAFLMGAAIAAFAVMALLAVQLWEKEEKNTN